MAKSKKIAIKDAKLTIQNGNLIMSGLVGKGEESQDINLDEKFKEFLNEESLTLKLTKSRASGGGSNRKPIYKFECPKCGILIKTSIENLNCKCLDCDEIFEVTE